MTKPKRAILDVDGILWDLGAVVRARAKAMWGIVLPKAKTWDSYLEKLTKQEFYLLVRAAHAGQIFYEPLKGAYTLFDSLNKTGHEVIVASHRERQTAPRLVRWLELKGLTPYSGIYTGVDKHFLIGTGDLVIDDAPDTIKVAQVKGAQSVSLTYPYNREALKGQGNGAPKPIGFHSLEAMATWIRQER